MASSARSRTLTEAFASFFWVIADTTGRSSLTNLDCLKKSFSEFFVEDVANALAVNAERHINALEYVYMRLLACLITYFRNIGHR